MVNEIRRVILILSIVEYLSRCRGRPVGPVGEIGDRDEGGDV